MGKSPRPLPRLTNSMTVRRTCRRRQWVLGYQTADGRCDAMVEGLRDYPHAGVWYLGLLLVRPAQRSQGIGARLVRACEALARAEGAVEMRLCVFDTSPRAWQF
jgi:GNAT superfamily N-acetyltransferase